MKSRPGICFLLLHLFVVLSANGAWACGSCQADQAATAQQGSSEKSCCSKDEAQTPCADDSNAPHAASNCPCGHDKGACHCPGCGLAGSAGAAFTVEMAPAPAAAPLHISVQKMAFYFADHLPEAVYLPVWQPPKLGA
ncbi:MAG: hypothetical protein ABIQ93_15955 [Saprospiraceae bacterium]